MFDSGMTARALIDEVNIEIDTAIDIEDSSYIRWINSFEQMAYSEIIKERKCKVLSNPIIPIVLTTDLAPDSAELQMIFEDIQLVYADGVELKKSTIGNDELTDTYYKVDNNLGINRDETSEIKVVYNVRPALKTTDNITTAKIMLPVEFLDLIISKLKGEAYKLANEDILAAKYLNDYNVLVEVFKGWVEDKRPKFGV